MYSNRVSQKLHDEHMATLALLERMERYIAKQEPPTMTDVGARSFLVDLVAAFETEVWHHFEFEEQDLFDYLAKSGDAEMVQHLTAEHVRIRSLGERAIAAARAAALSGFSPSAWKDFRIIGGQLADELKGHVDKEEGVLVPLLQDRMDGDAEAQLYMSYVTGD